MSYCVIKVLQTQAYQTSALLSSCAAGEIYSDIVKMAKFVGKWRTSETDNMEKALEAVGKYS